MEFNELQLRLWAKMIKSIDDFRLGNMSYQDLVYGLEAGLGAGEFHNDQKLIEEWYNYWTPLEILSATKGNNVTIEEADKYLINMGNFLKRYVC